MSCGIYKYTNKINGKSYIGQSVNLERRNRDHLRRAISNLSTEYNSILHKAIRKYGIENFDYEIIEECLKAELDEKERYYIKYYDTLVPRGYNVSIGGSNRGHFEKLDNISLDKIRNLLKNSVLTNKQIANMFNVSENLIVGIDTDYYWRNDNIDYPIRKKKKNYCKNCNKELKRKTKTGYCRECYDKYILKSGDEKIKQELESKLKELKGNFSAVGGYYNISDNGVRKKCKKYGLSPYSRDYI